jgi:hypothetical protein
VHEEYSASSVDDATIASSKLRRRPEGASSKLRQSILYSLIDRRSFCVAPRNVAIRRFVDGKSDDALAREAS